MADGGESPGGRPLRPSHPPDTRRHLRAGARPSTQTLSPSREVSSPSVRVRRTATANPRDEVQPSDACSGECVCGTEWLRQDREELTGSMEPGRQRRETGERMPPLPRLNICYQDFKEAGRVPERSACPCSQWHPSPRQGLHVTTHTGRGVLSAHKL